MERVGGNERAIARAAGSGRARLPFRAVNRKDTPGYQPGMQRHHLLPCQLLSERCFGPLFDSIGRDRLGFDDFRSNGLLLPASGESALRLRLPLHRGPHRDYNAMVAERVGQIEGGVFPGLGLAALVPTPDGGMHSQGLALFTGQELRLEPDLASDRATGAKIGLRLMHWLVEHGRLEAPERIPGPDGEPLRMEPSSNGRFVRVWRG